MECITDLINVLQNLLELGVKAIAFACLALIAVGVYRAVSSGLEENEESKQEDKD